MRTPARSGLLTTLVWVLVFSYGHIYNTLEVSQPFGLQIGRHRYLLPLWGLLLIGVLVWMRKKQDLDFLTLPVNVIALCLAAMPVVQMSAFEINARLAVRENAQRDVTFENLHLQEGQELPDIYYIILDEYSRNDTLQAVVGFENSPFIEQLEALGFIVATCSQSNYAQTELSLASSLNFDYLNQLNDGFVTGSTDRSDLWPLIKQSASLRILQGLGYTTVAYKTGYYWSQVEEVDVFLRPLNKVPGLNPFEIMFWKTTMGAVLSDTARLLPDDLNPGTKIPREGHRELISFTLDSLERMPNTIQSPKFIFAHIVSPHPPFVFGPDGEVVPDPDPTDLLLKNKSYRDQVLYLNQRVLSLVSRIITDSKTPPVILIQADHGIGWGSFEDRMGILNAYYLPGVDQDLLYETITPVNSFRVVFNTYFDGDFPLIEDVSYFSVYDSPYDFKTIENTCADP